MFITKAYSPNGGCFKRISDSTKVSKISVGEAPHTRRLDSQRRVSSPIETQGEASRTQEESIRDPKHLSPRLAGQSVYSPIELDDDDDDNDIDADHEHPSTGSVSCPGYLLDHNVEEPNTSDGKEDVQHSVLPPIASAHRRHALPFPRRVHPPGTLLESYPYPEDDPRDLEWVDDVDAPYYDDPEFTGFGDGRRQLGGFQSAKRLLQDMDFLEDEDSAYDERLQEEEDDIYASPVHRASPSPVLESIPNSVGLNDDTNDDDDSSEESSRIPKKKGPRVDDRFPLPPMGDLEHPYVGWVIDEVTMNDYMPNYGKQEGVAFTRIQDGDRVRWPCIHAGRYRNRNNLPAEVTERERRQELQNAGTIPSWRLIHRRKYSNTTWSKHQARVSLLCDIHKAYSYHCRISL